MSLGIDGRPESVLVKPLVFLDVRLAARPYLRITSLLPVIRRPLVLPNIFSAARSTQVLSGVKDRRVSRKRVRVIFQIGSRNEELVGARAVDIGNMFPWFATTACQVKHGQHEFTTGLFRHQ